MRDPFVLANKSGTGPPGAERKIPLYSVRSAGFGRRNNLQLFRPYFVQKTPGLQVGKIGSVGSFGAQQNAAGAFFALHDV